MKPSTILSIAFVTIIFVTISFGLYKQADDSEGRIRVAQDSHEQEQKRSAEEKSYNIYGRLGNGPAYGTMAPDFALMPLKFYEFGIDDREITAENAGLLYEPVRLSDFRGKKPVVLIFGSYT